MKILGTNNVNISGNCTNFPEDTYNIAIQSNTTFIAIYDGDYNTSTSVVISPEDAITIAEQILNFYKGGK